MLNVKVLGAGCPKCKRVERHAVTALEVLADEDPFLEATNQHVTGYDEIIKYPIMVTPALVVNEQVVLLLRLPLQGARDERGASQSIVNGVYHVQAMFTDGRDVAANSTEDLGTGGCTEST